MVLALLGCDTTSDEDPEQAARLHRSIDVLRDAENSEKAPYLDELRSQKCTTPRLCELKRVCSQAYDRHLEAIASAETAAAATPESPKLAQKLEDAKNELRRAEKLAQRCVSLQAELRPEG